MAQPRVAVARWQDIPADRLHRYWESLSDAGIEPVDFAGSGPSIKDCAGLVLTGGIDVDPARYGEPRHPSVSEFSPGRDTFEAALLWQALQADLPVLAICRGHQLLNVCLGGSLVQDIPGEGHKWLDKPGSPSRFHEADILPDTKLAAIMGAGRVTVNSRHHQGITAERLAAGLRVSATTPDGLIEGYESEKHRWVIGVQWHPEREEPVESFNAGRRLLFEAFREAMAGS